MWNVGSERRLRAHFRGIRGIQRDPGDPRAWEKVVFRLHETTLLAAQVQPFQHFGMSTLTLLNVFDVFSGAGGTLSAFWHVDINFT